MKRRYLLPLFHIFALWPSWQWYIARVSDPSDEPWGVLALLSAAFLLMLKRKAVSYQPGLGSVALLLLYCPAVLFLPPLPAAGIGILSIACSVQLEQGSTYPIRGLLLLSLPVLPSLQFYLGYPVRLLTAKLVGAALAAGGFPVSQEGVLFRFQEKLVWIDAPCSGVKMLWALSYITLCLIALHGLTPLLGALCSLAASAAAFFANCFRSGALLFVEAGVVTLPPHAHELIGLICFAGAAYQILLIVRYAAARAAKQSRRQSLKWRPSGSYVRGVVWAAALASAFLPLVKQDQARSVPAGRAQWPAELDGRPLERTVLAEREIHFAKAFPGEIARFRTGEAEVIGRYVLRPTRMLHPSSDCLKGLGYTIAPADAQRGSDGVLRSCVIAAKKGEKLRVCEFIKGADNSSFADVSSWF